jgi:hypothetical protein
MAVERILQLDYQHLDTAAAHDKLGEAVWKQVHKILDHKIEAVKLEGLCEFVREARQIERALEARIQDQEIHPAIQEALQRYMDSLDAWARGAKLDEYQQAYLRGEAVDGQPIRGRELAMILQTEQMGCQTGMIRDQDGAVWLWHTEEDVDKMPGGRFDALRVFSFRYGNQAIESFIYPDLLPGPSFGWKGNSYVQAVDTLYIKDLANGDAIPPNIATWVALCLGGEIPVCEIVQWLSPYQAGYALSAATLGPQGVSGENVEFTADHFTYTQLPETYGHYLFQVNLISDRSCRLSQKFEEISAEMEGFMLARIERTARAMAGFRAAPNKLAFLHQLIASHEGGEYAYVNQDVKAFILCRLSESGLEKWIGAGPANLGDELAMYE